MNSTSTVLWEPGRATAPATRQVRRRLVAGAGSGGVRSVGGVAGLAGEVVVLEAVAVALEGEDLGVVDEPVDHCGGGGVVAEDLALGAEGLVAGDDQAGALVAAGDEHEHEVRRLRVEWDVSDLVADEEWDSARGGVARPRGGLGVARRPGGRPIRWRSRNSDALAGEARADREGDREMGLAGSGWAEEDHVLLAVEEVELPEMLDDLLFDRALEGEVELLERLAGWEPCGFDPQLAAGSVSGGDLGGQQRFGEALIAPFLRARTLAELRHRTGGCWRLHRPEQVRELSGGAHAINRS